MDGLSGHSLPYRFSFLSVREGEESPMAALSTSVSPRSVAMKVAFLGGLSVPEGQVPLSISAQAMHCRWNMAPSAQIIGTIIAAISAI